MGAAGHVSPTFSHTVNNSESHPTAKSLANMSFILGNNVVYDPNETHSAVTTADLYRDAFYAYKSTVDRAYQNLVNEVFGAPHAPLPTKRRSPNPNPPLVAISPNGPPPAYRPSEVVPPAPRLVGIETNPGPGSRSRSMRFRKKGPTRENYRTVSRRIDRVVSGPAQAMEDAYLSTLNDPFEYGPIKLGYDCYTASSLGSSYLRGFIAVNADGTFSLASFPNIGQGFVYINTSGSAGTTWTTAPASNSGTVANSASALRYLSGGIRCFCLFPETSASGVLFAGTIAGANKNIIAAISNVNLVNSGSSELGIGTKGAAALMRPQDNDSYVFWETLTQTAPTTEYSQMSVPYIAGAGFPVGTIVWYEVIHNYEYLQAYSPGTIGVPPNNPNPDPAASDFFPSPEKLFSKVRPYLSDAAILDATKVAAGYLARVGGRYVGRSMKSAFGSGTHSRSMNKVGSSFDTGTGVMAEMQSKAEGKGVSSSSTPKVFSGPEPTRTNRIEKHQADDRHYGEDRHRRSSDTFTNRDRRDPRDVALAREQESKERESDWVMKEDL